MVQSLQSTIVLLTFSDRGGGVWRGVEPASVPDRRSSVKPGQRRTGFHLCPVHERVKPLVGGRPWLQIGSQTSHSHQHQLQRRLLRL